MRNILLLALLLALILIPIPGCPPADMSVEDGVKYMDGMTVAAEKMGVEVYGFLEVQPRVGMFTETSFGAPGRAVLFMRVVPKDLGEPVVPEDFEEPTAPESLEEPK